MLFRAVSLQRPRTGFTLIELLVVIGIILILVGLTTSAVMNFRNTGPRLATQSNLRDLKSKVNTQWKAVRDKAQTENMPAAAASAIVAWYAAQTPSVVLTPADPRVRAKYVEAKLMLAFPLTFAEATTPLFGVSPWEGYNTYLTKELGVSSGNTTSAQNQQAICLMMAVERGPSNLPVTAESLGVTGARLLDLGANPPPAGQPLVAGPALKKTQAYGCIDAFGIPLIYSRTSPPAPLAPIIKSTKLDPSDSANQ